MGPKRVLSEQEKVKRRQALSGGPKKQQVIQIGTRKKLVELL